MDKRNQKKKIPVGQIIALVVGLCALDVDTFAAMVALLLFLVPIGLAGYLAYRYAKKKGPAARTRQAAFDDCPQPLFCFHKDKGEHHVQRGKEIDPWDRPDIDIRKYQRRQ